MVFGIHLGSWVLLGWRVLVPVLLSSSPSTTHHPALSHTGAPCDSSTPGGTSPPSPPYWEPLGGGGVSNRGATASPHHPGLPRFPVTVPSTEVTSKA